MSTPEYIKDLIEKYQNGRIDTKELHLLNEWYNSFSDAEDQLFTDSNEEKATAKRIAARISDTLLEYQRIPRIKSFVTRKRFYVAAAAAFTILSFSLFYLFFSSSASRDQVAVQREHNTEAAADEIIPGGNKALLTLSDGSAIVLDSASNGTLGKQGNIKILKLNNGLLSYTGQEKNGSANTAIFNTISTPRGGQYQVTLSDGTKVWLNAASSIRFPVSFTGAERRVSVKGEAYFEVAHDQFRPFKVELNTSEIEVLGTHFNVNAYDDEASVKTTLLEGKVKLTAKDNASPFILLPGQQSAIDNDGNITLQKDADTEEAVAWIHGNFQFKSAELHTILRQISRWYDVDIEYKGNLNPYFTGQLPRSESVYTVFKHLSMTGTVHFTIEGRKVIVTP